MLTPSSGIVRANPEPTCIECKADLRNITRYGESVIRWRCLNAKCCVSIVPRGAEVA